jgi:hypothetical protein
LLGKWKLIRYDTVEDAAHLGGELIVSEGRMRMHLSGLTVLRARLAPMQGPPNGEIDLLLYETEADAGRGNFIGLYRSIYRLEGDVLTLCIGDRHRPTGFDLRFGSSLYAFRRSR